MMLVAGLAKARRPSSGRSRTPTRAVPSVDLARQTRAVSEESNSSPAGIESPPLVPGSSSGSSSFRLFRLRGRSVALGLLAGPAAGRLPPHVSVRRDRQNFFTAAEHLLVLVALRARIRVLWSTGARESPRRRRPEGRQLVNVVEEMAIASGLPRPRVSNVPTMTPTPLRPTRRSDGEPRGHRGPAADAFARRAPGRLAYELAHVQNLDIRLMTLLAGMVGAIALMSDGMARMVRGGALAAGGGGGGAAGGKGRQRLGVWRCWCRGC